MLNPSLEKKTSDPKLQGLGIYCNEDVLKKINLIADLIHWNRTTFITESIKHALNLIEHFDNNIVPDFVIFTRALQQFNRYNFHLIGEIKYKSKKIMSTCVLPPILLKKIDVISNSIGYSRNSFISLCLAHTINIVRDDHADPLPDIVKIARVCSTSSTFGSTNIKIVKK